MRKRRQGYIWRSFGDLMTGLMLVFLVVMVVVFIQMRVENARLVEAQQKLIDSEQAARRIVQNISRVVTTTQGLARRIQATMGDDFDVDPVTAELRLTDEQLRFPGFGQVKLGDAAARELMEFGPAYVCALWSHEYEACMAEGSAHDCLRLDPDRPYGVRRILVSGNADLMQAEFSGNLTTSTRRALQVQTTLMKILRSCGTSERCFDPDASAEQALCQAHPDLVWNYAQERLHVVGASHLRHCHHDPDSRVDGNCEAYKKLDASFRTVNFHFELSNADATSLVVDIHELESELGASLSMRELLLQLNGLCWQEDGADYAACRGIGGLCERARALEAAGDLGAAQRIETTYECGRYREFCAGQPSHPGCEGSR